VDSLIHGTADAPDRGVYKNFDRSQPDVSLQRELGCLKDFELEALRESSATPKEACGSSGSNTGGRRWLTATHRASFSTASR